MTKIESEDAEEIADKLRECLELVEPHLEAGSMKLRDAVDLMAEDPEVFARAILKYLSTDSMEEYIAVLERIWRSEGSHK